MPNWHETKLAQISLILKDTQTNTTNGLSQIPTFIPFFVLKNMD